MQNIIICGSKKGKTDPKNLALINEFAADLRVLSKCTTKEEKIAHFQDMNRRANAK